VFGTVGPQESKDENAVINILVSYLSLPDTTEGVATLSSSAWGSNNYATARIHYNQMVVDFTSVGGVAGVKGNLTQNGDIQWVDGSEDMWERALCSSTCSGASDVNNKAVTSAVLVMLYTVAGVVLVAGAVVYVIAQKWAATKTIGSVSETTTDTQHNVLRG
jgi:hypothetical protein